MGRSDFDRPSAEAGIDGRVGDNRDIPVYERQFQLLTNQLFITFVGRVDRDRGVSQQGFRPGGGYNDLTGAVSQGVADMPELPRPLLVLYLYVRQRGLVA